MTRLDTRLVQALGLSRAANEFAQGARAAGLKVPARFGTEVVARLLGLRTNHPAGQDALELRPQDAITRAETAFSVARILGFRGSELPSVEDASRSFGLPQLTAWQQRILQAAVNLIGYPYVWGGTVPGPEAPMGHQARGGFDCSGFVWQVYRLHRYADEGTLASMLRGRTTYELSGEVKKPQRIALADLQPADVIFFGAAGQRVVHPLLRLRRRARVADRVVRRPFRLGTAPARRGRPRRRRPAGVGPSAYSGMFPCLRAGRGSCFVSAVSRAEISAGRVRCGSMTSST
jgi:hypothetical protein